MSKKPSFSIGNKKYYMNSTRTGYFKETPQGKKVHYNWKGENGQNCPNCH